MASHIIYSYYEHLVIVYHRTQTTASRNIIVYLSYPKESALRPYVASIRAEHIDVCFHGKTRSLIEHINRSLTYNEYRLHEQWNVDGRDR